MFIASPIHLSLSCFMPDKQLGWAPKQDFVREFTEKDAAGNTYKVHYSLDHNGFREYGDPSTKHLKILFLGDSYTGDPKAGNEQMYFSVVQSTLKEKYNLDVEIFAAGAGGYGTLQEYLFIKKYISIIKPDVFILQFTDNDFTNNYWEWEKYRIVRNQKYLRPYYSLESATVCYAGSPLAKAYRLFYNKSFLFRGVDAVIRRLQYKYYFGKYKTHKDQYYDGYSKLTLPETYQFLRDSYPVTRELFLLLKNEFNSKTEFFTFLAPVDIDQEFQEQWLKLSRETGFAPLFLPISAHEKAIARGKVILNADGGHYNILGNKIMGEAIAEELYKHLEKRI